MKKKRSIGITILSIYFLLSGGASFMPYAAPPLIKTIIILLGVASVICAVALFWQLPWGRKATIGFLIIGMIYSVIYHSPIFQNQRVVQLESRYEEIKADNNVVSYSINDKEVTKEEYLNNQMAKIENERNTKFNFPYIAFTLIWNGLILIFISRKKVKQQFETESL